MQIYFYTKRSGKKPVQEFIDDLSKEDQSRMAECLDDIKIEGTESSACIFRQIKGKLWEIKKRGRDGAYRIFYTMLSKDIMLLLHAYRKQSQKAPQKEIAIATKRMKEVKQAFNIK